MSLQTQSSTPSKRYQFPKGFDMEETRLKRQEFEVKLRTQKRQNILQRRRTSVDDFDQPTMLKQQEFKVPSFPEEPSVHHKFECYAEILLTDNTKELTALEVLRKILSTEHGETVDESNALLVQRLNKKLISLLRSSQKKVQYDAAWCITNLACISPEINRRLVHDGAIQGLSALLSASSDMADMAVCGITNIVGDCCMIRNQVVESGVVEVIIRSIADSATMDLTHLSNRIHFLSALVHIKPLPPPSIVWSIVGLLRSLFSVRHDKVRLEVVMVLKALAFTAECNYIASECIGYAVDCLVLTNSDIQAQALTFLCVISDRFPEKVVSFDGLLDRIDRVLQTTAAPTLKSALKAMCNLLAHSNSAEILLNSQARISQIMNCLKHPDAGVVQEALCCVYNVCCFVSPSPLFSMVSSELFWLLSDLLTSKDPNLVMECLSVLGLVLDRANEHMQYYDLLELFDSCGGLHNLQELQRHPNTCIYSLSQKVLTAHYEVEEVESFVFS
jgi:hypothetical protein